MNNLLYWFCAAFISQIQAAFSISHFSHVDVERQTNIQTNIHTYTYKHTQFSKTIPGNQTHSHCQPSAGCGHVPGLKIGRAPEHNMNALHNGLLYFLI